MESQLSKHARFVFEYVKIAYKFTIIPLYRSRSQYNIIFHTQLKDKKLSCYLFSETEIYSPRDL